MSAEAGKEKGLLDPLLVREPLVIADRPTISAKLVWLNT